MTIHLDLSPSLEGKLHDKALQQGKEINEVITELLTDILEWEIEDTNEAIAGIQRGLNDFESGNYRAFDDFVKEQSQKYNLSSSQ